MAQPDAREAAPLEVFVSRRSYLIPPSLVRRLHGPAPPPGFECDGLTMAPDSWPPWWWPFGEHVDLTPAGVWHDASYRLGGTRRDRRRADARFYYNLQLCGQPDGWAGAFYRRVRLWGIPHFHWDEGEEPSAVSAGLAAFASRYSIPSPAELVPPREAGIAADAA